MDGNKNIQNSKEINPLHIDNHIPSHLLGYNLNTAGRIRIIFYFIIPTCLESLAYIIHTCADFTLSYQHFHDRNPLYGGLTLLFVCLPAFIWFILILLSPAKWPDTNSNKQNMVTIIHYDSHAPDDTNIQTTTDTTLNNALNNGNDRNFSNFCNKLLDKITWKFIGTLLISFILFPITAIFRFSHKIFWSVEALFHETGTPKHTESIEMALKNSTFELYHFCRAYAQSAPQIILQLYIILRQDIFRNYETTNMQVLSIIFAMINLAFITSSYQRFESQKCVGRYYPWATMKELQKHHAKFQHATSVHEIARQSLENDRKRQRKSDVFPENDRILEKLPFLSSSTLTDDDNDSNDDDDDDDENVTTSKLVKNHNTDETNDGVSFETISGTTTDNDDVDNVEDGAAVNNKTNNNNNNGKKINIKAIVETNSINSESNNEQKFLASSKCIDLNSTNTPSAARASETDTIDIFNVTDDDKLKNCQNTNNNNDKNNKKLHYQRTTSQQASADQDEIVVIAEEEENEAEENENLQNVIENGNKFHGSVVTPSTGKSKNSNRNSDDSRNSKVLPQGHHNNNNNNNNNKYYKSNTSWTLENAIQYFNEEEKSHNKTKTKRRRKRSVRFSDEIDTAENSGNNQNTIINDEPPQSPPPPPPPAPPTTATSSVNNPFDLSFLASQQINNNNDTTTDPSINCSRRQSNPFQKLSIYKDMLIYNTETYIFDNIPHLPQFIRDLEKTSSRTTSPPTSPSSSEIPNIKFLYEQNKESSIKDKTNLNTTATTTTTTTTSNKYKTENYPKPNKFSPKRNSSQLTNSLSSLNDDESLNITTNVAKKESPAPADTVDFFIPPAKQETINGIEQDDFFGMCTGFFGWFMFIYMRIVALSVFSVFYQLEFIYIILGHYILMLLCLCIDRDNFWNNLKKFPLFVFLAYVYVFVIFEFKIRFKYPKLWYISYFLLVMVENFTMTFLWKSCADNAGYDDGQSIGEFELNTYWWFDFLYGTTWGSFFLFLFCLFIYYILLRPKETVLVKKIYFD